MKSIAAKTTMLALLILLPSLVIAQTHTGSIRGTIIDPNGAVLPGAQISLVNEETNETRTTVSGEEGEFGFSPLVPSSYRLEAVMNGFQKKSHKLILQVGTELRQDISLSVETVSVTIDETFGADLLKVDSESTAIRTVIDNPQIVGLPLDGRNFMS